MSEENRIGVTISDFAMSQDLKIKAVADSIDYPCIVDRFLQAIREKLMGMGDMVAWLRPMIENAVEKQNIRVKIDFIFVEA